MKKKIIIIILILNSTLLLGQPKDYVILRQTETTKIDTIYGEIAFPKNRQITKIKILSNNKKHKYQPKESIGFKYGERYFASVPYNSKNNVFAERIINGEISLYYYDTNPNEYSGVGLVSGLAGEIAKSITSYFFIKPNTTGGYLRVSHSRKKAREEISFLFKSNEKIYNQILSENFRVWKLPEIVKEFNSTDQVK